jgi:hypothetical protein
LPHRSPWIRFFTGAGRVVAECVNGFTQRNPEGLARGGNGRHQVRAAAGNAKRDRGLVVGFMCELSRELSITRSSLEIYAAASVDDLTSLPTARLKAGHATLRKLAAEAAIPTIKRLGSVL